MAEPLQLDRRVEDVRISRMEELILELHAKVNNGLAERSIRTQEQLEELRKEHTEFTEAFIKHQIQAELQFQQTNKALSEITCMANKTAERMDKRDGQLNIAIWTFSLTLIGFAGWVVLYSDELHQILAPLFK